ncbi:uncharacterized protein FOMMEDRAFT_165251 [Fomitiporia mediterranea MF3/22]|uniref:uncharacterized protein n=1 Tax=Fomitiporia mediterranea (strain MF3/22) TaxID=694068 RepID=UPI00044083B3|nr:uncharacterized protein FOMMEDRAFT_165251 [Fomitiporia mediterranea MF3/22]EJD06457.1 hypothetical protein FOMMEDRAFT_165251 [Fomitiporia mediterranea MF3/22]
MLAGLHLPRCIDNKKKLLSALERTHSLRDLSDAARCLSASISSPYDSRLQSRVCPFNEHRGVYWTPPLLTMSLAAFAYRTLTHIKRFVQEGPAKASTGCVLIRIETYNCLYPNHLCAPSEDNEFYSLDLALFVFCPWNLELVSHPRCHRRLRDPPRERRPRGVLGEVLEEALEERLWEHNAIHTTPPIRLCMKRSFKIDAATVAGWFTKLGTALVEGVKAVERICSVKPYVTGFWETIDFDEYCAGPIANPTPKEIEGNEVYIVAWEKVAILNYSLWPQLWTPAFTNEDDSTCEDYGHDIVAEPEHPIQFGGTLRSEEYNYAHVIVYALLVISRAICYVITRAARYMLPTPWRIRRDIAARYELYKVPTLQQIADANTWGGDGDEVYKPLRKNLIRGPEALNAARRAGFTSDI